MTEFETLIARMTPAEQDAVLYNTDSLEVGAGEELTDLLDVDRAMCVVLEGEVEVCWEGHVCSRQGVGGVIGPAELFVGRWRETTVRATQDSRLWAVTPDGYQALRTGARSLARELEREALRSLAAQARRLAAEIAVQPHPPELTEPSSPRSETPGEPVLLSPSKVAERMIACLAPEVVPATELHAVLDRIHPRRYSAGDVVVAVGSDAGGVYLLAAGQVEVVVPLRQGGSAPVSTVYPGDLFAVTSAVDGTGRAFEMTATQNTVALEIQHADVERMLRGTSLVATAFRLACIRAQARMLAQANSYWVLASLMEGSKRNARRPLI